ncbi:MAG TPA: hypothetical protein VJ599_08435, partial [Nitrososphaeraceae archaeon]|nr:hypothetical protein [Nitrososphaeraceae archaeon]
MLVLLVVLSAFFPILQQSTLASHGTEVNLKFSDAQFLILPEKNMYQVKFTTTCSVSDLEIVG